jgi:hypothetical protein
VSDVARAPGPGALTANAAATPADNSGPAGLSPAAQSTESIKALQVQAQNATPTLNRPAEFSDINTTSSAGPTAHLTLGGTFQIALGYKNADGTFQTVPINFPVALGAASLKGKLDDNALFPGNTVFQYTNPVNNAVVLQAAHLGTQQITITAKDTQIPPVNITLSVEEPQSLGASHTDLDASLYPLSDETGVPAQMIKGQIGNESGFNRYAWRYEPLNGTVGDFAYSTKAKNLRTVPRYGSSLILPTIGDSVYPGNCGTYATPSDVSVLVNGTYPSGWSLNPTSGAPGTQVMISGTNFGDSQSAVSGAVTVNGVNAAIISWSNAAIVAQVPPYDYATHVDSRIQDQGCKGLTQGANFSQQVMEDIVSRGGGQDLIVSDPSSTTGAAPTLRPLEPTDRYVSVYDLFSHNPKSQAAWVMFAGGPHSPRVQSVQNRAVDFSAQLTLAASYGLIQVTYVHAIDAGWKGNNAQCDAPTMEDPDNLFDTVCNLKSSGGSLGIGTRSTETNFAALVGATPSMAAEANLETTFAQAFQIYNSGFNGYGTFVKDNAQHFEPNPTGTIFSSGGQQ